MEDDRDRPGALLAAAGHPGRLPAGDAAVDLTALPPRPPGRYHALTPTGGMSREDRAMSTQQQQTSSRPREEWTPRIWQGCSFPAFMRLLCKNGFAVAPRFFYMPLVMTTVSAINSALGYLQESWFGSRLDRTPIREPPLFII